MKLNEWKNKEMFQRLTEAYGYGKMEEEEEIDEAHCGGRREDDETMEEGMCPRCAMNPCGCPMMEEEEEIDEAHCGRREDEVVEEDVPTVKASDLDADDVEDGPGNMSVRDGKLVKVVNESQIRTLVREALKRAFKK